VFYRLNTLIYIALVIIVIVVLLRFLFGVLFIIPFQFPSIDHEVIMLKDISSQTMGDETIKEKLT
jgi:hypothetical protein